MLRPSIHYGFATSAPFVCLRCRLQRSNYGLLRRHSTRVSALEHVYLPDAGSELASPLSKKMGNVETSGQDDGNPQIARNPAATRDTKRSSRSSPLVRTHSSNSTLPTYRAVEAVTLEDGNSSQVAVRDRRTVAQVRHAAQMLHLSRTARRQMARKVASKSDLVKKVKGDALVKKFKSENRLAKKVMTSVKLQNTTEKTRPGKVKAAEKKTERLSAEEEFSDGETSKSVAEVMTARSSVVRRSRARARPKPLQEELSSLKNDTRAEENSVESSTLRLEGERNKFGDHDHLLNICSNNNRSATSTFTGLWPRSSPIQVGEQCLHRPIVVTDASAKPWCASSPRPSLTDLQF